MAQMCESAQNGQRDRTDFARTDWCQCYLGSGFPASSNIAFSGSVARVGGAR